MTNSERLTPAEMLQFLGAHANNPPYIPERDDEPEVPAPLSPEREVPICTQEAARAAGLDIAPSPAELAACAETIVRTWGHRPAEPDDEVASTADAGAQLARAVLLLLAELDRVRAKRDRATRAFDALLGRHGKVKSERDELNRALAETTDDRDRAQEAADKLAYAIAPIEVIGEHSGGNCPWTNALDVAAQGATEYGIRASDGEVMLSGNARDRAEQEARLSRYRDCWPDAVLVQRTVRHGEWTEVR
ncbi:hypothetical protein [Streptomyces sp. NPDC097640]|uniref:hypothetical protein n=1 Tax=Streptomyces sp. NPDC097640 TaxID=3157229 RepID=UPI003333B29F